MSRERQTDFQRQHQNVNIRRSFIKTGHFSLLVFYFSYFCDFRRTLELSEFILTFNVYFQIVVAT